jgi:microcin C transport system substrate-binding protein
MQALPKSLSFAASSAFSKSSAEACFDFGLRQRKTTANHGDDRWMNTTPLNRRTLLKLLGAVPGAQLVTTQAFAQDKTFVHGLSLFGDLKYPADFKHYDYVNPAAPKGGKLRLGFLGSFDTLNGFSIKGDPAVYGYGQILLDSPYETLMIQPYDQPATEYSHIASGVWHPADYSSVTFRLRPEARFHDGKTITVDDVIWSFETLRKQLPNYQSYYKNIAKVAQTGEGEVTFTFDAPGNRELPSIVGQIVVLPKHWWLDKDANGKQRDISTNTMEPPLGSGPYRIKEAKAGSFVRLERVKDYWAKDLPTQVGRNNFDEIEIILYRDVQVAHEAFKADQYDFRLESSSKQWATGYDFPAIKNGRCIKTTERLQNVEQLQAWVLNLRRAKFQDVRVRKAFDLAFDYEWTNKNLFYGQYVRCRSIFNNSELEAKGLPSPEELALLEPLKADLPPEVFTQEYAPPLNDTPQARRKNLREASRLLEEAGWKVTQKGNKSIRQNDKGEALEVEFVLDSPLFERIALPYKQELESLGISVNIRTIDAAQYERRVEDRDYDIISGAFPQSLSPGNEQREFWGTAAAGAKGSRNAFGIKNKAIDALIEKLIFAPDRNAQIIAARALDRAVMANNFFVPMWFSAEERIAYWNRFGRPPRVPEHALGFPTTWWFDDSKMPKI